MTKIAIPYTPPDLGPNSDFQTKIFRKNRESVLNELRCLSGIPEIVSTLNQDTVYKIVCSPEGGKLYADTAGNLKGVFYKDGKIVQHAKLRIVGRSLFKSVTAIGSQILLISIALQLNRVEQEIHRIIGGLHDDRISEIYSGVSQYKQAMLVQDPARQSRLIENAIQTLNTGIEKTTRSLKRQIAEMSKPEPSFGDDWPLTKKRTEKAAEQLRPVEESFRAYLVGIQTLAECFAAINEPRAAAATLKEKISKLSDGEIALAAERARLVPARGGHFPEKPLLSYLESKRSFIDNIERCELFTDNKIDSIEIEVKPVELLEGRK